MDLQLDQLRALDAAVTEGTFEAAARRLHVTPSAVSQRIKALEDAAGRILLRRTKPVQPTESGLAMLRLARQIELLAGDTARELGDATREPGDTAHPAPPPIRIPIAVNADSLQTWVMPALGRVRAGVYLEVHREDEEHTTRLLRDGTVMAAVTATATPVQGCIAHPLGAMRYRPVASPDFVATWFADGPTAKAFAAAPVVQFDRKDDLQYKLIRRHSRKPLDPPCHYIPSSTGFGAAIRLGLGWGMMPDIQAADDLAAGRLIAFDPHGVIDVPLYWQQWRLDSPTLRAIADSIAEAAAVALR
ncbi:LysR family transcriptional regulator ArgP [Nocardia sp. CC227C]|uniref:LysR family transcriptional regulator ArgP n=1 Tax=Nocardia sp. CC227C TaxID=3044562 RepID=UPI00278C3C07|nr:LysR family transcriptional regulator ArgP [Nocardia sp. CC227C]